MIKFVKTYFWEVIRFHYADFKGRASRKEYVCFSLFWLIPFIISVITLAANIIKLQSNIFLVFSLICTIVAVLILLICYLPILAISVRRLHDANLRGWWYLIWFLLVGIVDYLFIKNVIVSGIPIFIEFIVLSCLPLVEPNKFDRKEKKPDKMDEFSGNVQ
ncbi:MAG: DUF805 domain-containing protein [Endomicrobium sp.]|nr:DUF805 domain-containing protein [Endomicrobium sp.]